MNKGYFSIHRKLFEHWLWQTSEPLTIREAWLIILKSVNYKDEKVFIKGTLYDCKRGESLLSIENWGKLFNWNRGKVRSYFNMLEKDGMIKLEGLKYTTRLTVCNYETYQSFQPTENQLPANYQPTDNQQPTTTNNVNNFNNENNFNVCVGESQIFNSILSFFGFTPQNNPDKATHVSHFVNTLLQNGQLEHFKSQFEAYKEYKAKTSEKTHGFGSFLGEQAQNYTNGGWNAQNWKNKLKQAENKPAPGYPPARPRKKTHEENMREAAKLLGIDYDNNPFKNI